MKNRSLKTSLVTSTALATAVIGGTAMAAGNNPFASQTTQSTTVQVAEMSCGAGQCGSNMNKSSDTKKKQEAESQCGSNG